MSSIDPIGSLFPTPGGLSSAGSAGGPALFGNIFDQAMSHSSGAAQSARLAWLRTEYSNQNVLAGMFADPSSSMLGFGASSLFGTDGPFGLPSWAYDVQRVMSQDKDVQDIMSLGQQASMMIQSRLNHGLGSLGSLGGGVDSFL